ncbi:integrase, catalytic region, zinc finger, CCHC-type containing protein [Tanacetum coccineum]|uniref:Integrase, catalytic region, zinc finger, CCHC-type containing protein n=1 Tax=Tanacetum coccineum TaxID=301880 RepID=A0ABQ5CM21_9ASTR
MATSSRDRPPMLAMGRYAQWESRFMRYIDIKPNGDALRKCILQVEEQTVLETLSNISPENKAHYDAKKEAIHLLLTGIGDEIYLTVDACKTAHEMWTAIERLQHGESLNMQDVKTSLFWDFGKFTLRDGESIESYYSRDVDTSPRYKNDNQTGQFGNHRILTVVGARETVVRHVVQQRGIQCFNFKEFGHFAKECKKPKRTKDYTYHKEKMLLCKQANKGVTLQAEQADWLEDTDKEVDEQELEAHYMYMAKIQEVHTTNSGPSFDVEPLKKVHSNDDYNVFANEIHHSEQPVSINNTCLVEKVDSNVIPDSSDMCNNDNQADQNSEECDDEHDCKSSLEESNRTRDRCITALQNKEIELENSKEHDIKDGLKVKAYEIFVVKEKHDELVKHSLLTKSRYGGLLKDKNTVIKDFKLKEGEDIDKLIAMEKQLKFLNEIVYKRNQAIQNIHMLALKGSTYNGRLTFANPMYLKKAQFEKPCLYKIPYDTSDLANIFAPDREDTLTLEQESRTKLNKDLVKPYDYTKQNSLYENFKPPSQEYLDQLAHANEVQKKMWRKSFVKTKPNIVKNIGFLPIRKTISKSRQAYNVMTNNLNHFKQIVDLAWERHTHDAFCAPTTKDMTSLLKTCLMPLALKTQNDSFKFVSELKKEMFADLEYVQSLEKEIDELESDKADFSNIYDLLLQECVSKDVMCSYLHSLSDLDSYNELQCLYLHKVKECKCLAEKLSKQTEKVSKEAYNRILRSFAKLKEHLISLEISLQQCQEQMKNDTVCKQNESTVFLKELENYFEIQDLKAKLQDKTIAISKLKKLSDKCKGKSMETKFDKPFVVRQLNALRVLKPSVLGKPTPFSNSLERKSFSKTKSIVQLIIFIVDSGCTKHMTGNIKLLCNFVEKYLGTVRFGNDQFAPILSYGDLVQGYITIKRVYYIEGLNHNLFLVGQFCDADLEVAF